MMERSTAQSKHTYHGGIVVIELNDIPGKFLLIIKVIQIQVNITIMEVTNVLVTSSLNFVHEGILQIKVII